MALALNQQLKQLARDTCKTEGNTNSEGWVG